MQQDTTPLVAGLGVAGRPSNPYVPEGREPIPPDRTARQQLLERYLKEAHDNATNESVDSMWQGRVAIVGLAVLEIIRAMAWWDGNLPGSVYSVHFLTTTTDAICVFSMLPLFVTGTKGYCVVAGFVGPTLTLIFAMMVVDFGALCTFMILATPRPLSPGSRSIVDVAEAILGAWDFALFASVALQAALCSCAWRVYKALRTHGLYPPGTMPAGMGRIEDVSLWELVCEAEDIKHINNCDCKRALGCEGEEEVVASTEDVASAGPSPEEAAREAPRQ